MSKNNVIGCNGALPWHLSDDLKNFKKLTMGKPIIMGRKTFESIGKPLPGRTNIIISRNKNYTAPGAIVVDSMPSALLEAKKHNCEIMIIGGEQIYQAAMPHANKMYLTYVDAIVDGDAYFPSFDIAAWEIISKTTFDKSERNDFGFVVREMNKSTTSHSVDY